MIDPRERIRKIRQIGLVTKIERLLSDIIRDCRSDISVRDSSTIAISRGAIGNSNFCRMYPINQEKTAIPTELQFLLLE